jgi:hypothetical protein
MPRKTIIVDVDEEIELYLKHRLVEAPVRAGQTTKVCLNTSANDRVPGRRVVVELRMLPDGTQEDRLAPEDNDAGIAHSTAIGG